MRPGKEGRNSEECDLKAESRKRSHFSQTDPGLSGRTPGMCQELAKAISGCLSFLEFIRFAACFSQGIFQIFRLFPFPPVDSEFFTLTDDDSVTLPHLGLLRTGMDPGLDGTLKSTEQWGPSLQNRKFCRKYEVINTKQLQEQIFIQKEKRIDNYNIFRLNITDITKSRKLYNLKNSFKYLQNMFPLNF